MSTKTRKIRICQEKAKYATEEYANHAAKIVAKAKCESLRSYRCKICNCFHLTSQITITDKHNFHESLKEQRKKILNEHSKNPP